MNQSDTDQSLEEPEFDFDTEYDHVSNILNNMKEYCKNYGYSDLFEYTTNLDFFMFMQYNQDDDENQDNDEDDKNT